MKKKSSSFKNMMITLVLISIGASTTLGFVYEFTKEPIALAKLERQREALRQVLPAFDNDPLAEVYQTPLPDQNGMLECFPAKQGGQLVGVAVKAISPKGYNGDIAVLIGLDANGNVYQIAILDHKETPGLGSKMAEPKFLNQFLGKSKKDLPLSVKKDGGTVDAISGATITSRAFADALSKALQAAP